MIDSGMMERDILNYWRYGRDLNEIMVVVVDRASTRRRVVVVEEAEAVVR